MNIQQALPQRVPVHAQIRPKNGAQPIFVAMRHARISKCILPPGGGMEMIMTYHNESTERLFRAILSLQTMEECYQFFEDACTVREILDIAQRFEVAGMLADKKSYQVITKETGMSTATISRVNRCLNYGSGGYQLALERTKENTTHDDEYFPVKK